MSNSFLNNLLDVKNELYNIFTSTTVDVDDGMKAYPEYILEMDGRYVDSPAPICLGWSTFETAPDFDYYYPSFFKHCENLKYLPDRMVAGVANLEEAFYHCVSLEDISNVEFIDCSDFTQMFEGCVNLKYLPHINVKGENFGLLSMFEGCVGLIEAPTIDLPLRDYFNTYGNSTSRMFKDCINLETVPAYNMSLVADVTYMFEGCKSLKNLGGLIDLHSSLSLRDSPLLTYESLMNVINNLGSPIYGSTLALGEINLAKLSEDDIAIATNKEWVIVE